MNDKRKEAVHLLLAGFNLFAAKDVCNSVMTVTACHATVDEDSYIGQIQLHDEDGEKSQVFSPMIVCILSTLPEPYRSALIRELTTLPGEGFDKGFRLGQQAGRDTMLQTFHEVLGINKIAAAIAAKPER